MPSTMRRRTLMIAGRLAPAIIAAMVAFVALSGTALAHGNLDQSVDGDPGCNTGNFPASISGGGGQRQEFVPTGDTLSSVALCVSGDTAGNFLSIGIYRVSTGELVKAGSSSQAIPPFQPELVPVGAPSFVHVDFLQGVSVEPGETYAIQVGGGPNVTWYGTPPDGSSPYNYCLGEPNSGAVTDFGFRTYLAVSPGESAACPEPAPTNTPEPPPTNTPRPTSTPVPEATVSTASQDTPTTAAGGPTSVVAGDAATPGAETVADTAANTDVAPPGGSIAPETGSATTAPRPAGGAGGVRSVPNAGTGNGGQSHAWSALIVAMTIIGGALFTAGARRGTAGRDR